MNKKEISEVKKQFSPDENVITRICGCYVNAEKEIKCMMKEAFHSIPEEEAFKYFDIFKHTLSGTLGKNLINMDFSLSEETIGKNHDFLLQLKNSKLEDDSLVEEFYKKIIQNYDYNMNYYIILIHVIYDVPGKASDGMEMFDASDNVYEYIMCSICPVNLSKPGLSYNSDDNSICERTRDWVVDLPAKGFVFPAFNDRCADIHSLLYYTKNPEELQPEFIENVLGSSIPLSAAGQRDAFNSIIAESLDEECDYETIKTIHETLNEMIEENKNEPEPLGLDKTDLKKILEQSGANVKSEPLYENDYDTSLLATNITNTRQFNIETPNVIIKVKPERTDLVKTQIVDGRQCIVIAVDDHIEVNGVMVKTISTN